MCHGFGSRRCEATAREIENPFANPKSPPGLVAINLPGRRNPKPEMMTPAYGSRFDIRASGSDFDIRFSDFSDVLIGK